MSNKATVNDYLQSLPTQVQSRLYQSPATCLSIYRLLPSLAKFYIMSMIFNEQDVLLKDLNRWSKSPLDFNESIKSMKSLHILVAASGTPGGINLNPLFRKSFRYVLTGGDLQFGMVEGDSKVTVEFLDQFASSKWENILHYMVGTESCERPSKSVLNLLKHSKLMESGLQGFMITNEGFQFLLQDANTQIWTLLLQYLKLSESLQMDPVDVLNFIFMLGSLELGKDYSTELLSSTQVKMLDDLRDYGLVFQRSAQTFYPTRLATTLTSEATSLKSASTAISEATNDGSEESGAIIVETNFKLYSYSNSPLQIAILNLFVHLKTRFSNMVTGQITRESIRSALINGITAEQIISYIETHAHPQMKKLAQDQLDKKLELDPHCKDELQVLPPTVVDQIKLWQLELDRILTFDGFLFTDFDTLQEYQMLCEYSEEIGVLVWKDDKKKKFFVTKEGNSQIIEFAKRKLGKK